MSSISNPFEAVAAAATGINNTNNNNNNNNNNNQTTGVSGLSSLSSSTTELPSVVLTETTNLSTVDISRHPSGIVPVLQ